MAEQKEDLDRNEAATPFKLEKARKRGSIARSGELVFAGVLLVCTACVYGLGVRVVDGITVVSRQALTFVGHGARSRADTLTLLETLGAEVLRVIAPVIFVLCSFASGDWMRVGPRAP
jgi:flagellar biosynthetic protein FlhB